MGDFAPRYHHRNLDSSLQVALDMAEEAGDHAAEVLLRMLTVEADDTSLRNALALMFQYDPAFSEEETEEFDSFPDNFPGVWATEVDDDGYEWDAVLVLFNAEYGFDGWYGVFQLNRQYTIGPRATRQEALEAAWDKMVDELSGINQWILEPETFQGFLEEHYPDEVELIEEQHNE